MSVEVHILASGSDGNCTVIRNDDRAVMVDAGLSYKRIKSLMDINGVDGNEIEGLLVTHEHADHVSGAGVVARKLNIPVFCNRRTFEASDSIGRVDYRPIRMMNRFTVAGMDILALPTSHDAVEPCSYFLEVGGTNILIATDTGKITYPIEHAMEVADIAVVESNYDKEMLDYGPYPPSLKRLIDSDLGHMSNIACSEAVKRTMRKNGRKIFLGHLSRHNNTPDVAKDTISEITGIRRYHFDCLDCQGDTRIIRP